MIRKIIRGKSTAPLLSGDRVIIHEQKLASQLTTRDFGEAKAGKVSLNLYEALYLVEEGKLDIPAKKLISAGEKLNEAFSMKYEVFKDLREKGHVVRSGLKFGCDFVAYAHGKKPGSHSKWMVHVINESSRVDYSEITRAARLATNVKKKMLFATVTERGPVYYEVSRTKM